MKLPIEKYIVLGVITYLLKGIIYSSILAYFLFDSYTDPDSISPGVQQGVINFAMIVSHIPLGLVCGFWLLNLAKVEKKNKLFWFIAGFTCQIYAIVFLYLHLIYEKLSYQETKN